MAGHFEVAGQSNGAGHANTRFSCRAGHVSGASIRSKLLGSAVVNVEVDSGGDLATGNGVITPEDSLLEQTPPESQDATDAEGAGRSARRYPLIRGRCHVYKMLLCLIRRTVIPSKHSGRYTRLLYTRFPPSNGPQTRPSDTRIARLKICSVTVQA